MARQDSRPVGHPSTHASTRGSARSRLRDLAMRASGALLSLAMGASSLAQPINSGPCTVYTTALDFRQGQLFNLEIVQDPATGDACLRLKTEDIKPWPFIGVAMTGRGTVIRIATDNIPSLGINEGDVVGEYRSAPDGRAKEPSRTTIDAFGNIWVGNRAETNVKGSVTRIGLVMGGVRGDKIPVAGGGFSFVANPLGDYLQGPFNYCTCEDRDGDGLIRTSRGYPHTTGAFNADYVNTILPWTNLPAGIDDNGGVASADDECITAYTRTDGTGVRHVSVDGNNDVWVGGTGNRRFEKLDNTTATQVPLSAFTATSFAGGYGGLVDSCGILWSATWGPQFNPIMLRYDTNTNTQSFPLIHNYGVAFDPATCNIWTSTPFQSNAFRFPTSATPVTTIPHNSASLNRGIVVTNGEVWIANSGTNTLSRFTTAGTPVGSGTVNVSYPGPPFVNATTPHGVAVDHNGKIWAINNSSNNATRIDPNIGPQGTADLAVDLGAGGFPYNYSDMTGEQLLSIAPQGSWTFIHDGGMLACEWETVDWNAILVGGAQVMVRVRASDSPIPSGPWTMVQANVPFSGVVGQYLQVQVTLKQGVSSSAGDDCCRPTGEALLCDLTICKKASCTVDVAEIECALDGSGSVSATLVINNNSGVDAQTILITPMPPGNPIGVSPNIIQQFIADGSSATVKVNFSGLTSGEEFCFIVTLLDATGNNCCSVEVCITPDCDCFQIRADNEYIVCSPDGVPGSYLYTFQFDNLTPDTLHHIFFYPPAGVTITPNYIALVPPVGPNQTSQPIMVMITGATPGEELCFEMSIHDINLNQCCTREICIDIPICDHKPDPRGACCYERPGVPQPLCTVTTQADCTEIFNGTYLGDNTSCNPNPCIDDPRDTEVHLTKFETCCWPIDQSVTMTLTICNNSTVPKNYGWTIGSVTGPGCPNAVLPMFITPNMGSVTVPPGGCVNIPIVVNCEGTLGQGSTTCLEAIVTDLGTNQAYTASGQIKSTIINPGSPLPQWCLQVADPTGPIRIPFGETFNVGFTVANVGEANGALFYEVQGGGVLRINGNDPGNGFLNYATVAPGNTATRRFDVAFDEYRPGQLFDVVIFADLDSDGTREPVASIAFQTFDPTGCVGDATGDGLVDFADLNLLLSCFGNKGENMPADLNADGVVDFGDLNIMLTNFGTACN